jgi:hypothetical protein
MSRLASLRWVVEIRETVSWEAIAAFNVRSVAESYARECHASSVFGRPYRVVELPEVVEPKEAVTLELEARRARA